MEAANILIADTHIATRFGLIISVREVVSPVHIYQAWSPDGIISILQQHDIGLVIYDVAMSGMEDLGFIKQWRQVRPMVRILVFTGYSEQRNVVRLIRSGVNGFLSKESSLVGIQEAVLSMLSEGRFVSAAAEDMIIKNAVDHSADLWDPFKQLTGMEKQVLRLLLKGNRSKEVAIELGLHTSTVSLHKKRVFKKLGGTNLPYLIDKFGP